MSEADSIDDDIVRLLQVDGRMSNREIGRVLGIGESTVRSRLKRLFDRKAVRLGAVVAPEALGIGEVAYLYLRIAPVHLRSVARALAGMEEVAYLCITAGRFDLLAIITAADQAALLELVQDAIEPLPGISSVEVRQVSRLVKHRYDEVRIK